MGTDGRQLRGSLFALLVHFIPRVSLVMFYGARLAEQLRKVGVDGESVCLHTGSVARREDLDSIDGNLARLLHVSDDPVGRAREAPQRPISGVPADPIDLITGDVAPLLEGRTDGLSLHGCLGGLQPSKGPEEGGLGLTGLG